MKHFQALDNPAITYREMNGVGGALAEKAQEIVSISLVDWLEANKTYANAR